MGFKLYERGHNELVLEEIKCAVYDFHSEFPANRVVFMIIPANNCFIRVFLFLFYTFLLNHFL